MFGLRKRVAKLEEVSYDIRYNWKFYYDRIDHTVICDKCGGIFLTHYCKHKAVLSNGTAKKLSYCINCWDRLEGKND